MSDDDSGGISKTVLDTVETEGAKPVVKKPLDAKAERAARLAAALRTNLRRRKMPTAAARPVAKDQH